MRIDKENYYLNIAEAVLERSTCLRRRFGAVIVYNDAIISTGYNGSIRGEINCCDTGKCPRIDNNDKPGEGYENCVSVHAEQNALLNIARCEAKGSSLFLVGIDVTSGDYFPIAPCYICFRLIKAAGVFKIYIRETKASYRSILLQKGDCRE